MNYYAFIIAVIIANILENVVDIIENMLIFSPKKLNATFDYNLGNFLSSLNLPENITIKEYNLISKRNGAVNLVYLNNPNNDNFILHAHGRGKLIPGCLSIIQQLAPLASIVIFDYSGTGKSDGSPSEDNSYLDIMQVWQFMTKYLHAPPNKITLYGISLGGSICAQLASKLCENNSELPHGLIIQSSFCTMKTIASDHYPKILVQFLKSKFDTESYVKKIGNKIPVLISHSADDDYIGIYHKDELIRCNKFMKFYAISGDHLNITISKNYYNMIDAFVNL